MTFTQVVKKLQSLITILLLHLSTMFPAVAARSSSRGARLLSNFAKRTLQTDSRSGQAAAASQIQAGIMGIKLKLSIHINIHNIHNHDVTITGSFHMKSPDFQKSSHMTLLDFLLISLKCYPYSQTEKFQISGPCVFSFSRGGLQKLRCRDLFFTIK